MAVDSCEQTHVHEPPRANTGARQWRLADRVQIGRADDGLAVQVLPDQSVLYARIQSAGRKADGSRLVLGHLPEVAALGSLRGRWASLPAVTLVLPPQQVLTRDVTLPSDDPAELHLMLSHEIETLSPYGAEHTQYGYAVIGSSEPGRTAVRCFLAEASVVAELCEPFARRKIPVGGLIPAPLASLAGLRALSQLRSGCLYVLGQDSAAECIQWHDDERWQGRTCLLGGPRQDAEELAREVLTSLSLFGGNPAGSDAPSEVRVAGPASLWLEDLANQINQRYASPVEVHPLDETLFDGIDPDMQVPAIRLAGAAWLQGCRDSLAQHAAIVPQSCRDHARRRAVLRQDAWWVGLSLAIALLGWAALSLGNWRMGRLADATEQSIAPYINVAGEVAAKREQLMAARRQLSNRDEPLRILSGLADVTPGGVFYHTLRVEGDGTLTIDGLADSLHLAFELPESLRKSPLFTQIQLNYAQQSGSGQQPVVEFRCTCRARMTARQGGQRQ